MSFNHFNAAGQAIMVDVSQKEPTMRTATAAATVKLTTALVDDIIALKTVKGDVLQIARIAGIAAAKKTPDLIPLSHPLAIHHVAVDFRVDPEQGVIEALATVKAFERTGVEMEAMTAATVTALTIYDMCKGADKGITISDIRLLFKEGGNSGIYRRKETL
jgi:cyclic pyranopterin phosphate synthase